MNCEQSLHQYPGAFPLGPNIYALENLHFKEKYARYQALTHHRKLLTKYIPAPNDAGGSVAFD
jgi:hypothetical protein